MMKSTQNRDLIGHCGCEINYTPTWNPISRVILQVVANCLQAWSRKLYNDLVNVVTRYQCAYCGVGPYGHADSHGSSGSLTTAFTLSDDGRILRGLSGVRNTSGAGALLSTYLLLMSTPHRRGNRTTPASHHSDFSHAPSNWNYRGYSVSCYGCVYGRGDGLRPVKSTLV